MDEWFSLIKELVPSVTTGELRSMDRMDLYRNLESITQHLLVLKNKVIETGHTPDNQTLKHEVMVKDVLSTAQAVSASEAAPSGPMTDLYSMPFPSPDEVIHSRLHTLAHEA